jgi:hypothetical protein
MRGLALSLVALAGCGSVAPCRPGTVLVTLSLPANTDEIDVTVAIDGASGAAQPVHFQGPTAGGTLEVDFSSYVPGSKLAITVVAKSHGFTLGQTTTPAHMLAAGCDQLAISVESTNDMAGLDFAGIDFSTVAVDLAGSDLAPCVPQSSTVPMGKRPYGLVAGDWNGDGKPDIAVSSNGDNMVYAAVNMGGAKFAAPTTVGTGMMPYGLVTGDWNGDGKADLAVANQLSANVSVLLGMGNGTFLNAATLATGMSTAPITLVTADFNKDGKLDLATANDNMIPNLGGTVSIFSGYPFTAAVGIHTESFPYGLVAADWNRDGYIDLATSIIATNGADVLINNKGGGFPIMSMLTASAFPGAMGAGDWNGDGFPDLAVVGMGGDTVGTFLGQGDGTFQGQVKLTVGMGPSGILVEDLDGDQRLDLAVAVASGTLAVLYGHGDGTFSTPVSFPVGTMPYGVVAADFDGDGKKDLAVVDSGDNDVTILHNIACR